MSTSSELDLEHLTNMLAERAPVKSRDLAEALGMKYEDVRDALIMLEQAGIVYRTGKTRGTRWWLG